MDDRETRSANTIESPKDEQKEEALAPPRRSSVLRPNLGREITFSKNRFSLRFSLPSFVRPIFFLENFGPAFSPFLLR